MEYAIEIKNLTKEYKDFKLDDVSLSLPSGCIMGFIGENGSGKTTTIKLILDLIHKNSGNIKIFGKEMKEDAINIKEHIGVVMDECNFPETLNSADISKIMRKCFKTWNNEKFNEYIEKFSLPMQKQVKDFSKGMKMKLQIAVALSHDSRLLILDEATGGLDPIVRDEILDVFLDFIQDENHSIFISSHIITDLEKICDYITFLHKGKIIFCEEKDALLQKYKILKCPAEELDKIDEKWIIGSRKNAFGAEALVKKDFPENNLVTETATIEDIMLFFVRGERK